MVAVWGLLHIATNPEGCSTICSTHSLPYSDPAESYIAVEYGNELTLLNRKVIVYVDCCVESADSAFRPPISSN